MTFAELQTQVKDHLGLTSTEATTRIGKSINRHYRRITSSLGMDATRFVSRSGSTSIGSQNVTFTSIEKIDRIRDITTATAIRVLDEVSVNTIRTRQPNTGEPLEWSAESYTTTSVKVMLDTQPTSAYTLEADGWTSLSDLTSGDSPAFAESFHDILSWFVISEELLKKEKTGLAKEYQQRAEQLLSDLRFHLADTHSRDTRQATSGSTTGAGSAGGGGGIAIHAPTHESGGGDPIQLDDLAAPSDNTDLDATTTLHGLASKATAPGSGLLSVFAIGNGETTRTDQALFDTTNPAALGTAGPGTALVAARRDHIHTAPASLSGDSDQIILGVAVFS